MLYIPCIIAYCTWPFQTPTHTISYYTIHHTIPYHTIPCCTIHYTVPYTIPYHTILYHTIPYHIIPYRAPYHTTPVTTPYHTIPYHTIIYHTILYHTIPYHTILYYTIFFYTILYPIIPWYNINTVPINLPFTTGLLSLKFFHCWYHTESLCKTIPVASLIIQVFLIKKCKTPHSTDEFEFWWNYKICLNKNHDNLSYSFASIFFSLSFISFSLFGSVLRRSVSEIIKAVHTTFLVT